VDWDPFELGRQWYQRCCLYKKSVLFVLTGHESTQAFKKSPADIPQAAAARPGADLQVTLTKLFGVTGSSVSNSTDHRPITTLDGLWDVIDSHEPLYYKSFGLESSDSKSNEEAFFLLKVAVDNGEGSTEQQTETLNKKRKLENETRPEDVDAQHCEATELPNQQDYSNHVIFTLESELEQLDDKTKIRYVRSRLDLIRENHRYSAYLIA
jgi:hypothetical protein